MNLHQLLVMTVERADSLHVTTGTSPHLKIGGEWVPLDAPPLTSLEAKQLLYSVLTEAQKARLEEEGVLHFSFGVKDLARFLAVGYLQRGSCAAMFSPVPFRIPDPPAWVANTVEHLGAGPGLLIAAGPRIPAATALAWWIDHVNRTRAARILTLEEPITLLHPHKESIIDQVEIGADARGRAGARAAIRRGRRLRRCGRRPRPGARRARWRRAGALRRARGHRRGRSSHEGQPPSAPRAPAAEPRLPGRPG